MVLASNEWLSNCEDDQKSATASNTTTAATTTAAAASAATAPNPETAVDTAATQPALPQTSSSSNNTGSYTVTTTKTPAAVIGCPVSDIKLGIMAENTLKEALDNNGDELSESLASTCMMSAIDHSTDNNITTDTPPPELNDNNNREVRLEAGFLSCDPSENFGSNVNGSININSNTNSNSNTLQSAVVRQSKSTPSVNVSSPSVPLSSPITPQALSSALQSVMNSTVNSSTVAGNLHNTFLSSLGMDIGANAIALQQTAKQLSSSFCSGLTDAAQTNLANNAAGNNAHGVASSHMSLNVDSEPDNNGQAKIVLICEANSHPFQTRTILLTPNIECKVGRLIAKSKASESNAIFDCKVLSRNHAVLWYSDEGKFWVKDTKSSNGTFINENKLGTEPAELHFGDIVKFGVDVLENSRKEVHGCIIAFVKLYLPDGREAISIGGNTQRSQYTGEGRISFDEMHRLNLYMQEVAQREKALKSKLFNIQNVLDATRKNSAMCWQSLIAEDQLLHRIHSLEKKLQIMEKNAPESVLRNEVLKLLDDKNSYQLTAKEALRKVYQERCDAMQMLSKMESAYASSDNECKILRDQIMNTKQSLQDVNARLLRLETDYNEYKEEAERKQQEMKEQEEQRTAELNEKLRQRDKECEILRKHVAEFMLHHAQELQEYEEEQKKCEKAGAEKSDLPQDETEVNEEEMDEDDAFNDFDFENASPVLLTSRHAYNAIKALKKRKERAERARTATEHVEGGSISSGSDKEKSKETASPKPDTEPLEGSKLQSKDAKESTIMKWLQNSDMNEKEGSLDIFKAICNESDSGDEQENASPGHQTGAGATATETLTVPEDFELRCKLYSSKLQQVQNNLQQLEAEIVDEADIAANAIAALDDGSQVVTDDSDEENDDEREPKIVRKRNGKATHDERYLLLKSSVNALREAYNEMNADAQLLLSKQLTPPPAITVQTQFQNYAPHKLNNISYAVKKLDTQETLTPLLEATEEDDEPEAVDEGEEDALSETTTGMSNLSRRTVRDTDDTAGAANEQLASEVRVYQQQIAQLNVQLEQVENDSQHTLEIIQFECDAFKTKVAELTKLVETISAEKNELQQRISDSAVNVRPADETQPESAVTAAVTENQTTELSNKEPVAQAPPGDTPYVTFEQQVRDDLAAINNCTVQHEEELIVYKERLEQTQHDNLQLRHEIADLKLQFGKKTQALMFRPLAFSVAMVAIIIYFVYFY